MLKCTVYSTATVHLLVFLNSLSIQISIMLFNLVPQVAQQERNHLESLQLIMPQPSEGLYRILNKGKHATQNVFHHTEFAALTLHYINMLCFLLCEVFPIFIV